MSRRPKLSDEVVADLRRRVAAGESAETMAAELGIGRSTAYGLARGIRAALPPGPQESYAGAPELLRAVRESLAVLGLPPEHAGTAALAETYAQRIDDAQHLAEQAAEITLGDLDEDGQRQVHALRRRVEAITVMSDLGPKLHATLESLGASPRGVVALSGKIPPVAAPAKSRLALMRERDGSAARA